MGIRDEDKAFESEVSFGQTARVFYGILPQRGVIFMDWLTCYLLGVAGDLWPY